VAERLRMRGLVLPGGRGGAQCGMQDGSSTMAARPERESCTRLAAGNNYLPYVCCYDKLKPPCTQASLLFLLLLLLCSLQGAQGRGGCEDDVSTGFRESQFNLYCELHMCGGSLHALNHAAAPDVMPFSGSNKSSSRLHALFPCRRVTIREDFSLGMADMVRSERTVCLRANNIRDTNIGLPQPTAPQCCRPACPARPPI